MELVEGEGLDEVIARGPVPLDEAIPIALQIAEALEAAHEAGIVHRDLKPANVKIRPDGTVKVLDFGLAKAWEEGETTDLSLSPTLTRHATAAGVILGTAAYMAPEQARGKPVDRRADIWAFGVVVWEMLTGHKLFEGETVTDVLAAVLTRDPDLEALPPSTPHATRRVLSRCLERDPRSRLQWIGDARLDLAAAPTAGGADPVTATVPAGRRRSRLVVAVGIVLAGSIGALAAWYAKPSPDRPSWKLALAPPAEVSGIRMSPRISPDARSMAYIADGKVWIQDLDGLTPREIPRSDGATAFTWSPDGTALAFAARSELWRTQPNGDTALITALTEAISSGAGGLAWTADDEIVFSTGDSGLMTVPVSGGAPRSLLEPDRPHESDFHEPMALPDGRGIVFIVHRVPEGIDTLAVLRDGQRRTLYQREKMWFQNPAWSDSGHLLVGSSGINSGVWAVPVQISDLTVIGDSFLVAADAGAPSISRDGTLLISNTSSIGQHHLSLVDRSGERRTGIGEPVSHADHATFSPDGTHVAVCVFESRGESIWVYDLERDSRSRLWSNVQCGGMTGGVAWSPDGQRLLVADGTTGTVRIRRADGSDDEQAVVDGTQPSVSPDGRRLAYARASDEGDHDLWVVSLGDPESARPFLATPAEEDEPRISPDGRFVAYVSDETGRSEIHMRPFPEGTGQWQVSAAGGNMPRWSADGTRLFYIQDDDLLMEVELTLAGAPVLSDPRPLFSSAAHRLGTDHGYDVSPDGGSFVVVAFGSESGSGGDLTLISPWPGSSRD